MNQAEKPATASSRRGLKSFVLTLVVLLLGLSAWWMLMGPGKDLLPSWIFPDQEATLEPAGAIEIVPTYPLAGGVEERLEKLETLAISLNSSLREQENQLAVLDEFARSEDVQESVARLRGEIRGVREAFPEAAELERSQINLAWHLLQLAEMEYRLFGDAQAVVSILDRAQNLLRHNPRAIDLLVEIATMAREIEESSAVGLLEVSEELRAIEDLVVKVPLAASDFQSVQAESSGVLARFGAALRSLVRIERRSPPNAFSEVNRLQLLLGCERMQVAALRRDAEAFYRERESAIAWVERYADLESAEGKELLERLKGLQTSSLDLATVDFHAPLAALAELASRE